MKFESERVYLRELVYEDVTEEYISWFNDMVVTEFLQVKGLTTEDVIDYIKSGKEEGKHFMYAICDKATDSHIGNLKIGPIDSRHKISDLVTVIGDRGYWGKGYATEAITIGSKIAFDVYDLRKLTGGMYEDNIGSIKAYSRAGWTVEGKLRGHYLHNGKEMGRVLVSCFNPKYFNCTDFGSLGG